MKRRLLGYFEQMEEGTIIWQTTPCQQTRAVALPGSIYEIAAKRNG